ncbi:histidine phosphatase family protein [Shewanella sp. 30m-9]
MQTTKVILLRHGECDGGNILRGQVDVALTELGQLQMKKAFSALCLTDLSVDFTVGFTVNSVISSPLQRCANIAEQLAREHDLDFSIEAGFKELNFGDWDGQTFDALYQTCGSALDHYWKNPWLLSPPHGESMQDFEARIDKAWQAMLELHQGKTVLVVTHGGVIRHLMSKALDVSQCAGFYTSLKLPYAATVVIDVLHNDNKQFMTLNWR